MTVVEFTYGAGRVKVRNGCVVTYYGVITPTSFGYLRAMVIAATHGATALFFDMSAVVDTSTLVPRLPDGSQFYSNAPGAIVCREDQLVVWSEYASRLAKKGIIRAVFLRDDLPLAIGFVDSIRGVHLALPEKILETL